MCPLYSITFCCGEPQTYITWKVASTMSWEPGPTSYDRKRTAQTQSLVPAPCEKWRTEWHYKVHITGGGGKSEWSQRTYIMWTVNNWKMSQKQCHRTLVTGGEKKKKKKVENWTRSQNFRVLVQKMLSREQQGKHLWISVENSAGKDFSWKICWKTVCVI